MAEGEERDADVFAYVIPLEKYVYREGETWAAHNPVSREGIKHHLIWLGWPSADAEALLASKTYRVVHGVDVAPGLPPLFKNQHGQTFLNTWVPPTLKPAPGEYPTINRLLEWLTDGDTEGQRWLKQWIANKVQNPAHLPKVATLFGTSPGAGKGTLGYIISEMLGPENCATIEREAMGSRFNARWASKLFILADEVVAGDGFRDVSDRLKVLIDGREIELEGKGVNQRVVKNRTMWIFASNSRLTPVRLEAGDRRYTVFNNHAPIPANYTVELNALFEQDRKTPTAAFKKEMAAFYHDLLSMKVDRALVSRPFENKDREYLIEANKQSSETFYDYVQAGGIDELLPIVVQKDGLYKAEDRAKFDFGPDGLSSVILYRCYQEFCIQRGIKRPLTHIGLTMTLRNIHPKWPKDRRYIKALGAQTAVYVVPRANKTTNEPQATSETQPVPATPAPAAKA